jgi:predicted metal-dependent phosphoesterase TrpH
MNIRDIISLAKERGLDGVCITDHDTMDIRHELTEGIQANGLWVIFGMEYSTPQGDFLVFSPTHRIAPRLSASQLLRSIKDQDGVAVAAHPFRSGRSVSEQVIRMGLCNVVEGINGRNTPEENAAVKQWMNRYDLVQCGGSDAHQPEEIATFATRFLSPIRSRVDLIRALASGQCRPEIPIHNTQAEKELYLVSNS